MNQAARAFVSRNSCVTNLHLLVFAKPQATPPPTVRCSAASDVCRGRYKVYEPGEYCVSQIKKRWIVIKTKWWTTYVDTYLELPNLNKATDKIMCPSLHFPTYFKFPVGAYCPGKLRMLTLPTTLFFYGTQLDLTRHIWQQISRESHSFDKDILRTDWDMVARWR